MKSMKLVKKPSSVGRNNPYLISSSCPSWFTCLVGGFAVVMVRDFRSRIAESLLSPSPPCIEGGWKLSVPELQKVAAFVSHFRIARGTYLPFPHCRGTLVSLSPIVEEVRTDHFFAKRGFCFRLPLSSIKIVCRACLPLPSWERAGVRGGEWTAQSDLNPNCSPCCVCLRTLECDVTKSTFLGITIGAP